MTKGEATSRFCSACDALVDSGAVRNKTEFCEALHIVVSNFNLMRKGERSVTVAQLCEAVEAFRLSPLWVICGTGEMFL